MSTATETCACGASITCDASDVLALGWRLSDWRREHHHDLDAADACRERDEARADRDEWRDNATTLRGLLDNQAHNFRAMEQALRDVTAERDEARASVLAYCADDDSHTEACALWLPYPTGTEPACDCPVRDLRIVYGYELGAADLEAAEARAEKAEAAIARVRALCDEMDTVVLRESLHAERCIVGMDPTTAMIRAALDGEA